LHDGTECPWKHFRCAIIDGTVYTLYTGQRENDKLSGTTTCQRQKKDTDNCTKSRVEKDRPESDACDGTDYKGSS